MKSASQETSSGSHSRPMTLTLLVLFIIFPILILLEYFQPGGINITNGYLYSVFGLLCLITLSLAGFTVATWKPELDGTNVARAFPKKFKILHPIRILQDRKSRGQQTTVLRKKSHPKAPQEKPEEDSNKPVVSFQDWLTLPLFPKDHLEEKASVIDLAANGLIFIDDGGKIICANQISEEMLSHGHKSIVGVSVTDILPKLFPDTEEPKDAFERFTFKGRSSDVYGISRETYFITQDGSRNPVKLRMSKQDSHREQIIAIELAFP